MRHRAAAFGGAEVRGGDENGPISRRKSPSNGGPECRYDASLAAKHEIQFLQRFTRFISRACVRARPLPRRSERAGSGRLGERSGHFAVPSPAPPCSRQRAPRWPPPLLTSMLQRCALVHIASAGAKKLLMNAFCRADWELPISLSRNFSKLVSAAMSLPLIALRWPPFPSSRACAWP